MIKIKSDKKNLYQISRTNAGKGFSRFLGILLILWGLGLLYILLSEYQVELKKFNILNTSDTLFFVFILLFIFLLLIVGYNLIRSKVKTFDNSDVHTYSSISKIFNSLKLVIVILIFIIPFSFMLGSMNDTDSMDNSFRIFGSIVILIFWIATIMVIIDALRNFQYYLKYRTSVLLTDKLYYQMGSSLKLTLVNERLSNMELKFCLRNFHEYWENKNDSENSFVVYKTLFQEIKKGYVEQTLEFKIPTNDQIKPTFYDYNSPYYWSLEVSNEEHNYFSQFIINVY